MDDPELHQDLTTLLDADRDGGLGPRARLRALATWFDATPMELVALLILLVGGGALTGVVWWGARERPADVPVVVATPGATPSPAAQLTVHVAGAVARSGVVVLAAGSRVIDALTAVGGAATDADLGALNLARIVADGEQIVVPRVGATPAPAAGSGGDPHLRPDGRLDLNRATVEQFEELPGIGPVLAGRIVAWRDAHGPFRDVGQLREVSGIGERTFAELAELVAV